MNNESDVLASMLVPRYTSYPTAVQFNSDVDRKIYENWLNDLHLKAKNISFYVHIPFCRKLCTFCGCNMKIVNNYAPIKHYLQQIIKEAKILSECICKKIPVQHIHFGGGSPTSLKAEDFVFFMDSLKELFFFDKSCEIAIEIDPRTVDEKKIEAYAKSGVNRASIGVQDFNDKVQVAVNRVQSFEMVNNCINNLKKNGIKNINLDLMYGLPHQNSENIKNTMDKVLKLDADRLSVFGYAHIPSKIKHQRLIDEKALAKSDERFNMYNIIRNILTENEYQAIGIDHYSKKTDKMTTALKNGTLRRNFQGYTTDKCDALLAIGQSSIGWTPWGYMQNTKIPNEYDRSINMGVLPIVKGVVFSDEDKLRAKIIEKIMCFMKVDLNECIKNFKLDIDFSNEMKILEKLEKNNIVNIKDNIITINDKFYVYARVVASVFDVYLDEKNMKHSSAV